MVCCRIIRVQIVVLSPDAVPFSSNSLVSSSPSPPISFSRTARCRKSKSAYVFLVNVTCQSLEDLAVSSQVAAVKVWMVYVVSQDITKSKDFASRHRALEMRRTEPTL
jgi:hypothetical protein